MQPGQIFHQCQDSSNALEGEGQMALHSSLKPSAGQATFLPPRFNFLVVPETEKNHCIPLTMDIYVQVD